MLYYKRAPLIFDDSYYPDQSEVGLLDVLLFGNQTVQSESVIGEICDIYGNILEKGDC